MLQAKTLKYRKEFLRVRGDRDEHLNIIYFGCGNNSAGHCWGYLSEVAHHYLVRAGKNQLGMDLVFKKMERQIIGLRFNHIPIKAKLHQDLLQGCLQDIAVK